MKALKVFIGCLIFCCFCLVGKAQENKDQAREKAIQAVSQIELHQFDAAIKLLQQARKLDPDNYKILYQMALAYYAKNDAATATIVFKQLIKMPDAPEDCYQSYASMLNDNNQKADAVHVLEMGLKKFPHSGLLFAEKGNIYLAQKNYNAAIDAYEKGIEAAPTFAGNYYHAAKLFCYSNEEVWGMIYGELFMNLERNSKRTSEISKLLYDTYANEIKFTTDSTMTVSFSKNASSGKTKTGIDAFGVNAYEPTLIAALAGTKFLNINSLDKVRTKFLDIYFDKNLNEKFPNLLFDFQRKIKDSGYMDAYNHWVLYKGDETGFAIWQAKNKEKWDKFIGWYKETKLDIDSSNLFIRTKY